jgi:hypothetical protein
MNYLDAIAARRNGLTLFSRKSKWADTKGYLFVPKVTIDDQVPILDRQGNLIPDSGKPVFDCVGYELPPLSIRGRAKYTVSLPDLVRGRDASEPVYTEHERRIPPHRCPATATGFGR